MMPEHPHNYWLLKKAKWDGFVWIKTDVLGIIEFTGSQYPGIIGIGSLLGMHDDNWAWDVISKAEYETYQAFGFKEYDLRPTTL